MNEEVAFAGETATASCCGAWRERGDGTGGIGNGESEVSGREELRF